MASPTLPKPILMFSNNDGLIRSIKHLLLPIGFEVKVKRKTRTFLDLLKQTSWKLVLLDTSLSSRNRQDLLSSVRNIDPEVPLIVLVPESDLTFCSTALQLRADDVLTLPLDGAALKFRVLGRYREREKEHSPRSSVADLGLLHSIRQFHSFVLQYFIALEEQLLQLQHELQKHLPKEGPIDVVVQQTLLLVHPNLDFKNQLQALCSPHDIQVKHFFTGGEALDWAGLNPIDILLCDATLPDLTGEVVLLSLKAEYPHIDAVEIIQWGEEQGKGRWIDPLHDEEIVFSLGSLEDLQQLVETFVSRQQRRALNKKLAESFKDRHKAFMHQYTYIKKRLVQVLEGKE